MHLPCPNNSCSNFQSNHAVIKIGFYFRRDTSEKLRRFKCLKCNRSFSASTTTLEYRQKKRRINFPLNKLICMGLSQRATARFFNVSKITVVRKIKYLALKSRREHQLFLQQLSVHKINQVQIDDLITCEHTRLKPLTVTLAIEKKTRIILSNKVGRIPAFGPLAKISFKKYGWRENEQRKTLEKVFKDLSLIIKNDAKIESDMHLEYARFVKRYFKQAKHVRFKSMRAKTSCVAGQGELKTRSRDPLFKINHTLAMLRANLSRLFRRSWNLSKTVEGLQDHLDIYTHYHNQGILQKTSLFN